MCHLELNFMFYINGQLSWGVANSMYGFLDI